MCDVLGVWCSCARVGGCILMVDPTGKVVVARQSRDQTR